MRLSHITQAFQIFMVFMAFMVGVLLLGSGCSTPPPTRDDVGQIPGRLVQGIVVVKASETAFVEQKQALLHAVTTRQSNRISAVEKATTATLASLNTLATEPNWLPAQRELLSSIIGHYQAYFIDYGQLARLWIVEQPGRPQDSGLADQEKRLGDQEDQIRTDLKKLADMMAWELTRKIDTVNTLILKAP